LETIRGWEKIRKKENEKWEKGNAISQHGYAVDDVKEWSVKCRGTITRLGATTKKWMVGGERVNLTFLSVPLSNEDNSKQEAAAPAGEYLEDTKKPQQIIDLESKLNK